MNVIAVRRAVRTRLRALGLARSYRLVDLGTLGGMESSAYDLNDRGVVVGWSLVTNGHTHAFRWQAGQMVDLGALQGAHDSEASAVEDKGFIGGQMQLPSLTHSHGFVADPGSTVAAAQDVGALGGSNSGVLDISNDLIAVGWADVAGGQMHAFRRMHTGSLLDLTPSIAGDGQAEAVDGGGNVAGTLMSNAVVAFSWSRGTLTMLLPSGATSSQAHGMTAGQPGLIVGEAAFGGGPSHAAVWDASHTATDLGTLGGGAYSVARDANAGGWIVGSSEVAGGGTHAFLTRPGMHMLDLNTLIPQGSGWVLTEARAINAGREIAGEGTHNGRRRAFLLA